MSPIESPALLQHAVLLAELAELASKHRLPAVYAFPRHVQAGGLCSYGFATKYLLTRPAYYASRILLGAKPGDLPIELPSTYELSINMTTASAMGLAVSPRRRLRASELVSQRSRGGLERPASAWNTSIWSVSTVRGARDGAVPARPALRLQGVAMRSPRALANRSACHQASRRLKSPPKPTLSSSS
jgi:hypothetical protein